MLLCAIFPEEILSHHSSSDFVAKDLFRTSVKEKAYFSLRLPVLQKTVCFRPFFCRKTD